MPKIPVFQTLWAHVVLGWGRTEASRQGHEPRVAVVTVTALWSTDSHYQLMLCRVSWSQWWSHSTTALHFPFLMAPAHERHPYLPVEQTGGSDPKSCPKIPPQLRHWGCMSSWPFSSLILLLQQPKWMAPAIKAESLAEWWQITLNSKKCNLICLGGNNLKQKVLHGGRKSGQNQKQRKEHGSDTSRLKKNNWKLPEFSEGFWWHRWHLRERTGQEVSLVTSQGRTHKPRHFFLHHLPIPGRIPCLQRHRNPAPHSWPLI